jgi:hypothetical protein
LFSSQRAKLLQTTGVFDAARLADLVQSGGGTQAMFERIQIMRSLDMDGVVEAIHDVQQLHIELQREGQGIGIVIIDFITNPLSMMMQHGQTQGHDLMVCLSRDLTQLSRQGVCVLVVNTTVRASRDVTAGAASGVGKNRDVAFDEVGLKPALGSTWPFLMDYSLQIYPVPNGTVRKPGKRGYIQEVVRSRVGGVGEWEMV